MQELHINGTQRLVSVAQGKIGRWVQLSSVGVYGIRRNGVITEDSKEQPFGVYEQTKAESDKIVKNSGIPYVILRPSNVFGNGMPNQSLRGLLHAIRRGLFFFIGKENESLVNYIHVADVVNALICCGSHERSLGKVFNLSQSATVEKMINSFASGMESDKKILRLSEGIVRVVAGIFGWIPGFPLASSRVDALTSKCVYNSTKVQRILGFRHSMTLEERFELFSKQK
jgi:nucleoside-diphosphate-sugar epimerase